MLSVQQSNRLIVSLATVRGRFGFTDDEAQSLLQQANDACVGWTVFEAVIRGLAYVDVRGGEVMLLAPEQLPAAQLAYDRSETEQSCHENEHIDLRQSLGS
jgi:hypothetical protein